ncbi:MAG: hypothetical protein N3D84_00425 [Candidatus Woesearchaeota archaeon]|nr:hypothetical protein [Candidatus Woesearchaeota archaeon]
MANNVNEEWRQQLEELINKLGEEVIEQMEKEAMDLWVSEAKKTGELSPPERLEDHTKTQAYIETLNNSLEKYILFEKNQNKKIGDIIKTLCNFIEEKILVEYGIKKEDKKIEDVYPKGNEFLRVMAISVPPNMPYSKISQITEDMSKTENYSINKFLKKIKSTYEYIMKNMEEGRSILEGMAINLTLINSISKPNEESIFSILYVQHNNDMYYTILNMMLNASATIILPSFEKNIDKLKEIEEKTIGEIKEKKEKELPVNFYMVVNPVSNIRPESIVNYAIYFILNKFDKKHKNLKKAKARPQTRFFGEIGGNFPSLDDFFKICGDLFKIYRDSDVLNKAHNNLQKGSGVCEENEVEDIISIEKYKNQCYSCSYANSCRKYKKAKEFYGPPEKVVIH